MSINVDAYNVNQQSYTQAASKNNTLYKLLGIEARNIKPSKSENVSNVDSYIPSTQCQLWVSKIEVRGTCITQSVLDRINFGKKNFGGNETEFIVDGVVYSYDQIPSMTLDVCNEIKAENNAIVFEAGKYYKFNDEQGNSHILACTEYDISQPYSESMRDAHDKESVRRGDFWSMMASNGLYIGLYFSYDEQRQILNEAGITDGFFSVQVGDDKQEYYNTGGGTRGLFVLKSDYDDSYNMYTKNPHGILNEFDVGAVFIIDGEEYVLGEDKTLDIPYGIDIFDVKFPKRYYSEQ